MPDTYTTEIPCATGLRKDFIRVDNYHVVGGSIWLTAYSGLVQDGVLIELTPATRDALVAALLGTADEKA
jgi:hypothetical protein